MELYIKMSSRFLGKTKLLIKKSLTILGIDGAILYTSAGKIVQLFGRGISLLFIAKYLSLVEQGYFYTFGSILGIQVFFELGIGGVITQYVAHEKAHLKWDGNMRLIGSDHHLSRLSSILRFSMRWYLVFAGIQLIVILIAGFFFFNTYKQSDPNINWQIPWILLTFSGVFSFMLSPVLAFFEGLGLVKEIAKIRMIQQTISIVFLSLILFLGAKLYASGFSTLVSLILLVPLTFSSGKGRLFVNIWKSLGKDLVSYTKEIFPFQWKIALSWISGYFIFQLFNPVLFATQGSVVAGQMGMTLSALNGILGLSLSWMTTKIPLFSNLIAQKKYADLDLIFDSTLKKSVFVNGMGLGVLLIIVGILRLTQIPLGNRFLPYFPMIFMMIAIFLNQYVSSWAIYLRSHKKEPLLVNSVVGSISTGLSTLILGKYYGVFGMTAGYSVLTFFIGFLWVHNIYKKKKRQWHE